MPRRQLSPAKDHHMKIDVIIIIIIDFIIVFSTYLYNYYKRARGINAVSLVLVSVMSRVRFKIHYCRASRMCIYSGDQKLTASSFRNDRGHQR